MTPSASRPFCADVARESEEPLAATASRIEHWLLIEYAGRWPSEPLGAAAFAGPLREQLAAHLATLPRSRLLLVKRAGRRREENIRVVYGRTAEDGGRFHELEVERHADLLDVDLVRPGGVPLDHPLLLVCTHGLRDRCCARYGQALLREVAHRADPRWVWQATHVGGDRFAGNLVILPEALYFGRVGRDDVAPILASHAAGRIELLRYRGRSCHPFAVQAAEGHVRRAAGLAGIDELKLLSARRDGRDRFTVELLARAAGRVHEVAVAVELGEPTLLTCKAHEPQPPRRYVVTSHRERKAA